MSDNNQIEKIITLFAEIRGKIQEKMRQPSGYSSLHIFALFFIQKHEHMVMKDIADFFGITPPSATALIEPMAKAGLVRRVQRKADRRIVELILTKKGQFILKQEFENMKNKMRQLLSVLDSKDRLDLIRVFEKISKNINP